MKILYEAPSCGGDVTAIWFRPRKEMFFGRLYVGLAGADPSPLLLEMHVPEAHPDVSPRFPVAMDEYFPDGVLRLPPGARLYFEPDTAIVGIEAVEGAAPVRHQDKARSWMDAELAVLDGGIREIVRLRGVVAGLLRCARLCGVCTRPATYARAMCDVCDVCAADESLDWGYGGIDAKESCLLPQAKVVREAQQLCAGVPVLSAEERKAVGELRVLFTKERCGLCGTTNGMHQILHRQDGTPVTCRGGDLRFLADRVAFENGDLAEGPAS